VRVELNRTRVWGLALVRADGYREQAGDVQHTGGVVEGWLAVPDGPGMSYLADLLPLHNPVRACNQ